MVRRNLLWKLLRYLSPFFLHSVENLPRARVLKIPAHFNRVHTLRSTKKKMFYWQWAYVYIHIQLKHHRMQRIPNVYLTTIFLTHEFDGSIKDNPWVKRTYEKSYWFFQLGACEMGTRYSGDNPHFSNNNFVCVSTSEYTSFVSVAFVPVSIIFSYKKSCKHVARSKPVESFRVTISVYNEIRISPRMWETVKMSLGASI